MSDAGGQTDRLGARVRLDACVVEWRGARSFRLGPISLEVAPGRTLAIAGASGSGKSTLLDLVAGLRRPDRGAISFDGADRSRTPPERRDVALVTQDAALYDDESVARNLDLVLHARGVRASERPAAIDDLLGRLGVAHLRDANAGACSGGERRRVAIAKALARAPRVLLLDEPFAGLGPSHRREARSALRRAIAACSPRPTVLLASHEIDDAHVLADELAVLDAGAIAQQGDVRSVVAAPTTRAVAETVTDPPGAVVPVELVVGDDARDAVLRGPGIEWRVALSGGTPAGTPAGPRRAWLHLPPDAVRPRAATDDPAATRPLDGWRLVDRERTSTGVEFVLSPASSHAAVTTIRARRAEDSDPGTTDEGDAEWIVETARTHLFDDASGGRLPLE